MDIKTISSLIRKPIKGKELQELFKKYKYGQLLSSDKLFNDPSDSLKAIQSRYGFLPSVDGINNPDIRYIREQVYRAAMDVNRDLINGLVITAPHTHWPGHHPITYHFEKSNKRYLIGPLQVNEQHNYTPVSFIFGTDALPYEWIDESIEIPLSEILDCYEIILKVNDIVCKKNTIFGLAIDFRFRESLLELAIPSMELPFKDNHSLSGYSYIINNEENTDEDLVNSTEQVSWHAISDHYYQFNFEEKSILDKYRTILDKELNMHRKEMILINLEKELNQLMRQKTSPDDFLDQN